ncbi:Flp pilus assembly complex ATPase component TadA [Candidatus Saccharibacteria bacterium]|nr:Flp pilus assembly complex ATPase component TadA [Candidatus Saccharibacteria bacterium]MBI3337805.1 Flp pilus assembly complex ATPase component TadA [Candidatus Saccharibacteria bacterium]
MSILSAAIQKQVEEKLINDGLITKAKFNDLKAKADADHVPVLGLLIKDGQVSNEVLTKTVSHITKVPYVNLSNAKIDQNILQLLPQALAERYMSVPLGEMHNRLVVAMLDAGNVQAVDFLSNKIGRPLKVYAASEEGIRNVIKQYNFSLDKGIPGSLTKQADTEAQALELEKSNLKPTDKTQNIKDIVQDSPISKALTTILEYSANNRASDIHIEPLEKELRIRCRIDGVLREIMKLPKSTEPALISRIKILSNLKIDEHRIPQDGTFTVQVGEKSIDLRIAISPVVWGEQVVIRLLDKSGTSLKLEDMGYAGRALHTIRKGLKESNGLILTSGPTGSGKSTSMYALIQEIKNDSINIVTLEDPVEYKVDGVNQIQVNSDVGLTFAAGLRSILRQDPNVVMVGEIRDKETATLAVQAALTGHLVFSTLHTNSAAGILPRLLDMGIEPFLIASTVHTVIGQRLVRRIAGEDKETRQSDKPETEAIRQTVDHILPEKSGDVKAVAIDLGYEDLPLRGQNAYTLYQGKDSPDTPGGYKGRMGLYEVFEITDTIQDLILKRSTSSEIQKAAQAQGMVTMREDGYLKALVGQTTIAEVNRVASVDSA